MRKNLMNFSVNFFVLVLLAMVLVFLLCILFANLFVADILTQEFIDLVLGGFVSKLMYYSILVSITLMLLILNYKWFELANAYRYSFIGAITFAPFILTMNLFVLGLDMVVRSMNNINSVIHKKSIVSG